MKEIQTYEQRNEWLSNKQRIGFIGSKDIYDRLNDIWTIELYKDNNEKYSLFIITDSDESWLVVDF